MKKETSMKASKVENAIAAIRQQFPGEIRETPECVTLIIGYNPMCGVDVHASGMVRPWHMEDVCSLPWRQKAVYDTQENITLDEFLLGLY